jgi:hypothetical protein
MEQDELVESRLSCISPLVDKKDRVWDCPESPLLAAQGEELPFIQAKASRRLCAPTADV